MLFYFTFTRITIGFFCFQIEIDYKREFEQYENKLFSSFPTLSSKILAKVEKSKDQNIIKLWEANKNLENEGMIT